MSTQKSLYLAFFGIYAAIQPAVSMAKDFNKTYAMQLPPGAAYVSVVNKKSTPTNEIKQFILVNADKDLLGQVKIDRLIASASGIQNSNTALWDTELYLTGQILPYSTQQLADVHITPIFDANLAPTRFRFVDEGRINPGNVASTGCYDFKGNYACSAVSTIKETKTKVLDTLANGLTTAVFSWSGVPGTSLNFSSVNVIAQGKIDNYQITPGIIKLDGTGIPENDIAFNNISYLNEQTFKIAGVFTNKAPASLETQSNIDIGQSGQFNNAGLLTNNVEANLIQNNGRFRNEATGTVENAGWFMNGDGSKSAPFDNQGTVNIRGNGDFYMNGNSLLYNNGQFNIDGGQASAYLEGPVENGSSGKIVVTNGKLSTAITSKMINYGSVEIKSLGQFVNKGEFNKTILGNFHNSGVVSNSGLFKVSAGNTINDNIFASTGVLLVGGGVLENHKTLENNGSIQVAGPGKIINTQGASITNTGIVNIQSGAELSNAGKIFNQNNAWVVVQAGAVLNNSGIFANNSGGTLSTLPESTVTNSGSFTNSNGNVSIGGNFFSPGSYTQIGGLTRVDGLLEGNVTVIGGRVQGRGNIHGNVIGTGGVTVGPGNSPGTLTISGDLTLNDSILEIELGSSAYDSLIVTGAVNFTNDQVRFILTDGFVPTVGSSFQWLVADTSSVNPFANLEYAIGTFATDGAWTPWQLSGGAGVNFSGGTISFSSAVPLPSSWLMLLSGLAWMSLLVKKRPAPQYG